jgi:hypothetical protein
MHDRVHRTPGPSIAALAAALAVGVLPGTGCGSSGGGGGASATGSAAAGAGSVSQSGGAGARGPILLSATLDDVDGDGAASRGDGIVLGFDAEVEAGTLALAALRLLSAQDSLGAGASVLQDGASGARVVLGTGAALTLYDSYRPVGPRTASSAGANRSPAAVSLERGGIRGAAGVLSREGRWVPVVLPPDRRARYQPEQWRGAFSPFLGQMHAHTSYSDGQSGTPGDAYDMARFQGGLDWFVVTDHLEFLPVQPWKYPAKRAQAEARTVDGSFVAIWGYEWGSGIANPLGPSVYNHVNILSDRLVNIFQAATLDGFYREIARLGDDPVCKFNHPNARAKALSMGITITFDNWDDYRYDGPADRFFRVVKTMQGSHDDAAGYIPLLDHGWHVGPGFGEDNHGPDWGRSERRMGVYTSALTREGILSGMRARRTFTSGDRDGWARLAADDPAGPLWMGSTVVGPGPVTLVVDAGDGSDGLDLLEIVSTGGAVLESRPLGGALSVTETVALDPSDDAYLYARITESDGDLIYTAPIFVDR